MQKLLAQPDALVDAPTVGCASFLQIGSFLRRRLLPAVDEGASTTPILLLLLLDRRQCHASLRAFRTSREASRDWRTLEPTYENNTPHTSTEYVPLDLIKVTHQGCSRLVGVFSDVASDSAERVVLRTPSAAPSLRAFRRSLLA